MTAASQAGPIRTIHVVIPARNEAAYLTRALTSVDAARRSLGEQRPEVRVDVTVALDRCDDRSATVVRAHHGVARVELTVGDVGRARAVGIARALATALPVEPTEPPGSRWDAPSPAHETTWVANTDADSRVPPDWLTTHIALAEAGFSLVLGLVRPVGPDLTDERLGDWLTSHDLRDGHGHIFGANLGVRASAYHSVGGFRAMAAHEDVDLANRVRAAGFPWVATSAGTVATSARRRGRTRQGFAAALHAPRTIA